VTYFFFLDILTIDGLVELDLDESLDRRSSDNFGLYGMMDCNDTVQFNTDDKASIRNNPKFLR